MDGFEATGQIRRLESGKRHVPIIAMTALTTGEDCERCKKAGMNEYLTKPVTLEALQWKVEVWTGKAPDRPLLRQDGGLPPTECTQHSLVEESA
jgi:CheY-like chemotaxis protein